MGRRPVTSPSNEALAVVPVFTPDPHGAAMFAGIVNGNLGHMGSRPILAEGKYHGWAQDPQAKMRGAGNLGAAGHPVTNPVSTFDQQRGAVDPIQSLFAERANERRF